MELFKDTEIKIHKTEKHGILAGVGLVGFILVSLGIGGFQLGGFAPTVAGFGLTIGGIAYPIMVYRTLNGKGMYKSR